jgi:hypothetical protein
MNVVNPCRKALVLLPQLVVIFCFTNFSNAQNVRPEFVGGKAYSSQECLRIAKWATHDDEGFNQLTGVELGNLWFTLDNCDFLYFDETQPHPKPTKTQISQIEFALHLATHHYIGSLEKVIMQLPEAMRHQALNDLNHILIREASANDISPWSPFAQDCADAAQIMNGKPKEWKATDPAQKKVLEKCAAAMDKQSKGQGKVDETKPH